MNVFVSYSREDAATARSIAEHVEARGYTAFIDYFGISGGDEFVDVLGRTIEASDVVLVLLSHSAVKSKWVRWEIGWALDRRKVIVPVLLESVSFASVFPLASLHHLDFRDGSEEVGTTALQDLDDLLARIAGLHPGRNAPVPPVRRPTTTGGEGTRDALPLGDLQRLVSDAIAARDDAPETSVYLGRLVLQQDPSFLGGWLRGFIEGLESDLRGGRIARFDQRLRDLLHADDLDLAEAVAQDILRLDPRHRGAHQAITRIRRGRQCSALYDLAAHLMTTSRDSALFLLSEVRHISEEFPDTASLLAEAQITLGTAPLEDVAKVGRRALSAAGSSAQGAGHVVVGVFPAAAADQ
jgi:hypothetical protein